MAKSEICYAVIDAASEPDVFSLLDKYNPPACCLYSEPLQPDIAGLAPYLVEVTEEVRKWLDARQTPWGIYIYATASMRELRHHLRKFTMVVIPDQEKPVFWRFYDPRNIWETLATFDNWRLHTFLGPVTKLETTLWGNEKSDRFEEQRKQYPEQANMSGMFLKFSSKEYEEIDKVFELRLWQKMTLFFAKSMVASSTLSTTLSTLDIVHLTLYNEKINYFDESKYIESEILEKAKEISSKLVSFFVESNILDYKAQVQLCYLFAYLRIFNFSEIPKSWLVFLIKSAGHGNYRVSQLMIDELGMLPLLDSI